MMKTIVQSVDKLQLFEDIFFELRRFQRRSMLRIYDLGKLALGVSFLWQTGSSNQYIPLYPYSQPCMITKAPPYCTWHGRSQMLQFIKQSAFF